MKSKIAVLVFAVLFILSTIGAAYADSISGSGLGKGALGSAYCALAGCSMTGDILSTQQFSSETTAGTNIQIGNPSGNLYTKIEPEQFYSSRNIQIKTSLDIPYQGQLAGTCSGSGVSCTDASECCNAGSSCPGTCSGNSQANGDIYLETNSTTGYIYIDGNGGTDELTVGNLTTSAVGDFTANSVLYVDDTTDMVGINDATPTADLDVLGTTRLELVASAPTCDADTDDGVMYYKKGSNGSGLCVCMWDGAADLAANYTIKATITFGTFIDSDC